MLHSSLSYIESALGPSVTRADEIAVICHELRNSLAVVRGAARLLRVNADDGGLTTTRSLIERQVDQMSRHVDDLMQTQRLGGLAHGLELSVLDLRVIARNAADGARLEMKRRRHSLTVSLPAEPVWTRADAARMEQVFSNLLINAAKYTPDGGEIHLSMEPDHGLIRTCVRDTGVGIETAMLARIFGMFVQADNPLQTIKSGSGIGLAVVANLVGLHGGVVRAASPGVGLGSTFTVILPLLTT